MSSSFFCMFLLPAPVFSANAPVNLANAPVNLANAPVFPENAPVSAAYALKSPILCSKILFKHVAHL